MTILSVSFDEPTIRETGQVATGTVTRVGTTGLLVVNLTSDDTGEATVPATVIIPDGSDSATFPITGVDDFVADGTQTVTVTAAATGFTSGLGSIKVLDNEQTNIVVTDVYLTDGDFNRLDSSVLGERLYVAVEYTTFNLPGGSNYDVFFTVDGVTLAFNDRTSGAGFGVGVWRWIRAGWYSEPGTHTVSVTVDANSDVVEDDETDNTGTFMFTPASATDLPQKFIWPLAGQPFQDHYFTNYVDLDPQGGIRDYNGGAASYNGHNAIDAGEVNFAGMDEGAPIFAAADGVVIAAVNGGYDRNRGQLGMVFPGGPSNTIDIDHGNGWVTRYFHLRRDSLHVEVGDVVAAGDVIAYEGSSGNSTGSHVHFEVRHNGLEVATYLDPNTFWQSPLGYVGDDVFLIESGVSNYDVGPHLDEGPSSATVYDQTPGVVSWVWGYFSGLRAGDSLHAIWRRPDDSIYGFAALNVPQNFSSSLWYFFHGLPPVPDLGTWSVEFLVNGVTTFPAATFEVTNSGAPEIRIEDNTGEIVVDERYTPFDFGTVPQGGGSPTQTFAVINHGSDVLNISSIEVPVGFTLTDGLPATLARGASDTFTVALDTSASGYYAGEVKVFSDDSDESESSFSVEGRVTSGGLEQITLGISRRRMDEGTTLFANVSRTGDTSSPLTVTLASGDASELTVPPTVMIPAGRSDVLFQITGVQDLILDGDQTAGVTATATGLLGARNEVVVRHIPVDALFLSMQINGGGVNRSGIGTLGLTFDLAVNVAGVTSLTLFNHTTGTPVDVSTASLIGNGSPVVVWNLANLMLPNGRYTAELIRSQATSIAGGSLATPIAIEFHILSGDLDGDGIVNFNDTAPLSLNFGQSGPAFRDGDGNGDGLVNFDDTAPISLNFGTSLAQLAYDFGDAPETGTSYPTTSANNGARHVIHGNVLFLGADRDGEPDGQPSVDATGDGGDENGLVFDPLLRGTDADVSVTSNGAGFLNGWVDFNQDGDWDDPGEQVFNDQPIVAGASNLQITIPAGATLGSTFARFRLTENSGYSYFGLAPNGEAEDYQLTVTDSAPELLAELAADTTASSQHSARFGVQLSPLAGFFQSARHPAPDHLIAVLSPHFSTFGHPLSLFATEDESKVRTR